MKIAVCLTGHVRSFERTFPQLERHLLSRHDADVFIHTWDVVGHQHREYRPRPTDQTRAPLETVRALYAPARMVVEDNADVLRRWRFDGPIYVADGQAEPQYIYSQLYSTYRANRLKLEHERAGGFTYDVTIRLRFDFDLETPLPERELEDVVRHRETLYVGHPLRIRHPHPGGGGGCRRCETAAHPGPHANDVCDVFVFGCSAAMDTYAALFDHCLDVYRRAARDNDALCERLLGWSSRTAGAPDHLWVPMTLMEQFVACFYPERLLREYLAGHRLLSSGLEGRILRKIAEPSAGAFTRLAVPVSIPLWVPTRMYPALLRLWHALPFRRR